MKGLIEAIEREGLKENVPRFNVGDTVKVGYRIIEGGKERIQNFEGVVIAKKHRCPCGQGEKGKALLSPRPYRQGSQGQGRHLNKHRTEGGADGAAVFLKNLRKTVYNFFLIG